MVVTTSNQSLSETAAAALASLFLSFASHCEQAISAPDAWALTTGSSAVGICVIDTGARTKHEDLQGDVRSTINR